MKNQKNEIVNGLHGYLKCDVIPTDTADKKPEYPYISYKIINLLNSKSHSLIDSAVASGSSEFEYDIKVTRREQMNFNMSVSAYSLNDDEAQSLAVRAVDWFKFIGYEFLKDINVVVVSISNISDRTIQIVDDYEKRYGFDVVLRTTREIEKIVETIDNYSFNYVKGGKNIG